jgi:hypothetical protein
MCTDFLRLGDVNPIWLIAELRLVALIAFNTNTNKARPAVFKSLSICSARNLSTAVSGSLLSNYA